MDWISILANGDIILWIKNEGLNIMEWGLGVRISRLLIRYQGLFIR